MEDKRLVQEISLLIRQQTLKETVIGDVQLRSALEVYKTARMDGLCHEGAWECVLENIQSFNKTSLEAQEKEEPHYA